MRKKSGRAWRKACLLIVALLVVLAMIVGECFYLVGLVQ